MDCTNMIERLKSAGIVFDPSMTQEELTRAESTFGFRFPCEIREFLACGCPTGEKFFDYRDCSEENKAKFDRFQERIRKSFLFDLEHNAGRLKVFLGEPFSLMEDSETLRDAVLAFFDESPRLIPFYAHRCFFDGMDGMPIVSFWQAVDSVVYGSDFENYLTREFLDDEAPLESISDYMKETGIWASLIRP